MIDDFGSLLGDIEAAAQLKDTLEKYNLHRPTEVQKRTVPAALAGDNLIVQAAAGQGKTIAFCLSLVARLVSPDDGGDGKASRPENDDHSEAHEVLFPVRLHEKSSGSRKHNASSPHQHNAPDASDVSNAANEPSVSQSKKGSRKSKERIAPANARKLDKAKLEAERAKTEPREGNETEAVAVPHRLRALVLTPTREIALQVAKEMAKIASSFLRSDRLSIVACVGGAPIVTDVFALYARRPHVLIATTGRLLSLLRDPSSRENQQPHWHQPQPQSQSQSQVHPPFQLPALRYLVLDEADLLLASNFRRQTLAVVSYIRAAARSPLQVLMFSATYPPQVLRTAEQVIRSLAEIPNRAKTVPSEDFHEKTVPGEPCGRKETTFVEIASATEANGDIVTTYGSVGSETNDSEGSELQRHFRLRKVFLVSSYIETARSHFEENAPVPRAKIYKTDSYDPDAASVPPPVPEHVRCSYVEIDLEVPLDLLVNEALGVVGVDEPDERSKVAELVRWVKEDAEWRHWEDLLPKVVYLIAFLWRWAARPDGGKGSEVMVFCNDPFSGEKLAATLTQCGLPFGYICSTTSQKQRSTLIRRMMALRAGDLGDGGAGKEVMNSNSIPLFGLVCSDVVARGVDLPGVSRVICLDLPDEKETVLHRVGRVDRSQAGGGETLWLVRAEDELLQLQTFAIQTGLPLSDAKRNVCTLDSESPHSSNNPLL